ncbi:MAG: WD40 repeat domain-containing protein [Gemmataceae bacterium]
MRRGIPAIAVAIGLAIVVGVMSSDGKAGRVESSADALPARAICRIGSSSFRHGGPVTKLAYTRDGKTLYSACPTDQRVRLWDSTTGRELKSLGESVGIESVVVLAEGKVVATADDRKSIRLWDTTTAKEIRRCREPEEVPGLAQRVLGLTLGKRTHDLAVSADGKTLASLYQADNTAMVWDASSGAERVAIRGTGAGFSTLDLAADGKAVFVGTRKGSLASYDTTTGESSLAYNGFSETIQAVAVSSDRKLIAALAEQQGLRLWDVASGKEVHRDPQPFDGAAVAFSPDGKTVAYSFADKEGGNHLRLFDTVAGKPTTILSGLLEKLETLSFSPDGKTLAAAGTGNTIRFFDVATGKERDPPTGHAGAMTTIGISPDGRFVVTCSVNDNVVRLWDAQTGREVRRLEGNEGGVDEVQYSPDGRYIASAKEQHPVYVWEAATGKLVRKIEDHPSIGTHIRFSPDGSRIVTGGTTKVVAIWEVVSGKLLQEYATPPLGISSIATFDDNAMWAVEDKSQVESEEEGRHVAIFDLMSGKVVRRLLAGDKTVGGLWSSGIAISVDRRSVAVSGKDGVVRVYELLTGAERQRFADDGEQSAWRGTQFLAFSPDGRMLATCGTMNPVTRVWDISAGTALPPLAGHRGMIGAVDVSADGRRLITGSQDTTCLVWDMARLAPAPRKRAVTGSDLLKDWDALRDRDAAKAYRSHWNLVGGGAATVEFMREQLKAGKAGDSGQASRWVLELDSPKYAARERATAALIGMLDEAEALLRQTLATTDSAEVRQRVRMILDWPRLREVRTIEVLESLATPEAQTLLSELARGPDGSLLTREAKAALQRLSVRVGVKRE